MSFFQGQNMGMNMPYGQNNMYGQQMMNGMQQTGYDYGQGIIRHTKAEIIQGLRDYVVCNTGMPITVEVKIDETPDLLRHACASSGVSKLTMCHFYVYDIGLDIPFYFCMSCGKLFYPRDIMI